jgi:RNA polymerase sigma factor (sigma-70 family)
LAGYPERNVPTPRKRKILLQTYLARRSALIRLLKARLGSQEDAEDVIQELYFRLQRAQAAEVSNRSAYIYQMALNLARDHRRERERGRARDSRWQEATQTMLAAEAVEPRPSAEDAYGARQKLDRIIAALDELSPQCRRVFVMHKFEGLTHTEIMARLGIGRSTVEKHMTTALKFLTRRLGCD